MTIDNGFTGDIFGVAIEPKSVDHDSERITFAQVEEASKMCAILGVKLRALNLAPGEPGVYTTISVG
jgi:hypothetical protein